MTPYRAAAAAAIAGQVPGSNAGILDRHLPPARPEVLAEALLGVLDTIAVPGIQPDQLIVATRSGRFARHVTEIVEALGGTAHTAPARTDMGHVLVVTLPGASGRAGARDEEVMV